MKSLYYSLILFLPLYFTIDLSAQETRYFQFRAFCGGDDWRDTSFVASASNADQWLLAEVAVEVCDGCPFTNVHQESNIWLNNVGFFCPWTSKPVREITLTDLDEIRKEQNASISLFPNPSRDQVFIRHQLKGAIQLELINIANARLRYYPEWQDGAISVAEYPAGIYTVLLKSEGEVYSKRLVIQD